MVRSPLQLVEIFHLLFLRVLERAYERKNFVVKGGVNIRAWFGSARYSEDMDIDAIAGEPHSLESAVDKLVAGRDFELLLKQQGLEISSSSKPKMTDTTQRWKFVLAAPGMAMPLRTKVEFSWREDGSEPYLLEPVRSELAKDYGIPAASANHYTAAAAIRQKIKALAFRRESQARDVWDLDHLFRQPASDPRPLPAPFSRLLEVAEDRIWRIDLAQFVGQVRAYLGPADQEVYGAAEEWDRIRTSVLERLLELRP